MGVYVFAIGKYIKIGKYCKSNPWSRVAHRGFKSVRCPPEVKRLSKKEQVAKLTLVAWFPKLTRRHEAMCHRALRKRRAVGEWFQRAALRSALVLLNAKGVQARVRSQDKTAAMRTRRRL